MVAKKPRRGGRPKLWAVRILLPLSADMLESIDRARKPDETRLDLIRAALIRELRRRK
jgi:hypothetical protein